MSPFALAFPATAVRPVVPALRRERSDARRSSTRVASSSSENKQDRIRILTRCSSTAISHVSAFPMGPRRSVATGAMLPGTPASDNDEPTPDQTPNTPFGNIPQNYVWNAPGWEAFVKLAYVGVAALICNNILFECFPYGLGTPPSPPEIFSCEFAEVLVMLSGVLLGAFDFGPQCGAQIRGGLKALDVTIAKQRQDASNFLGLVLLKILSDGIGLALLAAPAFLVPDWLPRSAGIGIALLGRSAFVENCAQTFSVEGVAKPVPDNIRAIIAIFDRTLAFMALSVAYGTYSQAPYVAVTSAVLFFAGALYFAFGEKLLGKK